MAESIRTGKKLQHRDRKNGASREEWEERKQERNTATGHQKYNLETKTYTRE